MTLLSMSSVDSSAAPSTVSAPVRMPTMTLTAATAALSRRTTTSTRRTPAQSAGALRAMLEPEGVVIGRGFGAEAGAGTVTRGTCAAVELPVNHD